MKTKEELDALKKECESLGSKLQALNEEELAQVTGGIKDIDILIAKGITPGIAAGAILALRGIDNGANGSIGPIEPPDFRKPTQVRCRQCHTSYMYADRTNYCGFCGASDWCTDLDPEFFNY